MTDSFIDPTREAFATLKGLPLDHPVDMLNLVSLHLRARYEEGREARALKPMQLMVVKAALCFAMLVAK